MDKAAIYFWNCMKYYFNENHTNEYDIYATLKPFDFMIEILKFFHSTLTLNLSNINSDRYPKTKNIQKFTRIRIRNQKIIDIIFQLSHKCSNYVKYLKYNKYIDRNQRIWVILGDMYCFKLLNFEKAILCYKKAIELYNDIGDDTNYNLLIP